MNGFLRYRPMNGWADPITEERSSSGRFQGQSGDGRRRPTPLSDTEMLLIREADAIGASEVIIEVDAPSGDFYKDGTGIRADRREPTFPGVVVHLIGTRFGDLRYSCDQFEKTWGGHMPGWQGNLRAVALGLESLRRVERYGIGRRGEQYAGWAALPPGTPLGAPQQRAPMSLDEAARRLSGMIDGLTADDVLTDLDSARTCYRLASKRLHPDNVQTGNAEAFMLLQEAWELVEKHHAG